MARVAKGTRGSTATRNAQAVLPASMWSLLREIGAKIYGEGALNSQYAGPICCILADGNLAKAAALQKRAVTAYRDFAKSNVSVKFAP